jgi:hypothetical protein
MRCWWHHHGVRVATTAWSRISFRIILFHLAFPGRAQDLRPTRMQAVTGCDNPSDTVHPKHRPEKSPGHNSVSLLLRLVLGQSRNSNRTHTLPTTMSEPTIAQRVNHIKKAWHEGRPAYGIITKAPGQSLVRTLAGLRRYGLDVSVQLALPLPWTEPWGDG